MTSQINSYPLDTASQMKELKDTQIACWVKSVTVLSLVSVAVTVSSESAAAEYWDPVIVPRGEYREQLSQIPITERPGRPLHVYGNTVRYFNSVRQPGGTTIARRPLRQIIVGAPQGVSLRQAKLIQR